MTKIEKYKLVFKEVATRLNELGFTLGLNNYFDVMCGTLDVSRYITINNINCIDNRDTIIDMLIAYRDNDWQYINEQYTILLNEIKTCTSFETDSDKYKQLIEVLSVIYNHIDNKEEKFKSIDDVIAYNNITHLERFETDDTLTEQILKDINILKLDYSEINVPSNTLVFFYDNFRETDSLLYQARFRKWIRDISLRDDIEIAVLSFEDYSDKLNLITDFNKLILKRRNGEKCYLKLWLSSSLNIDDNDIEF